MPYFPYSRQSKKKQHRGAITARMVANLLHVAGVNHVITIDLHASQMQGFFKCPVDNLIAEPLIARWIRVNVPNWKQAVVVSKNPGGTKRVTSLADALKLSFGIVTTDRRRTPAANMHWRANPLYEPLLMDGTYETRGLLEAALDVDAHITPVSSVSPKPESDAKKSKSRTRSASNPLQRRSMNGATDTPGSPLVKSTRVSSVVETAETATSIQKELEASKIEDAADEADASGEDDEYTDEVRFHGRGANPYILTFNSEREMSFMAAWFKVTLLRTVTPRLRCPRPRPTNVPDLRPTTMKFQSI